MLLLNAIETPDGTLLISRHPYDYQTHLDENGKVYMVDGGLDCPRKSHHGDEVDRSIKDNGTLERARDYLQWGTYGKNADDLLKEGETPELIWVSLCDLSNAHIERIIEDSYHNTLPMSSIYYRYLTQELEYREKNKIVVEDDDYDSDD